MCGTVKFLKIVKQHYAVYDMYFYAVNIAAAGEYGPTQPFISVHSGSEWLRDQ